MRYKNVCVAGTFDPIHDGHLQLFKKAFEIGEHLWIGVTSDRMARENREREVTPYNDRLYLLLETLDDFKGMGWEDYMVSPIDNIYGDSLRTDMDAIVVSEESVYNAMKINQKRKERGIVELHIIPILLVKDCMGKKLSSTNIVKGEVDTHGNVV